MFNAADVSWPVRWRSTAIGEIFAVLLVSRLAKVSELRAFFLALGGGWKDEPAR
jgi:hypothetical protein